ncbi:perlucin-like protein [Ptychodera flava]|uniref:perlucin-like protein n=1 Tax=Ptychodera flava TaxID=63121 RepID=UPI00396A41DE
MMLVLLSALFIFTVSMATDMSPAGVTCPSSKYEVFCQQDQHDQTGNSSMTYYEEAEAACEARNGTLATLKDAASFQAVQNLILANMLHRAPCINTHGFWIGLDDRDAENNFRWSDNTTLGNSFVNWAGGEPNNKVKLDSEGQDCVQLWFRGSRTGQWDDEYCNVRPKGFVCEMTAEFAMC